MIHIQRNDHGGYTANDDEQHIFYSAPTPTRAVLGVQVLAAVDADLPWNDEDEDARYDLMMKLVHSVVEIVCGKTEAAIKA